MCDCSGDCDDSSDETTGYAGCSGALLATCPSGAQRKLYRFYNIKQNI